MSEEEMAEEYEEKAEYIEVDDYGKKRYDSIDIQQAFLAGLKAKTHRHDLREDPNDLPKDDRYVLIATQKRVYLGFYDCCCWFSHETDDIGEVYAWCEIPHF